MPTSAGLSRNYPEESPGAVTDGWREDPAGRRSLDAVFDDQWLKAPWKSHNVCWTFMCTSVKMSVQNIILSRRKTSFLIANLVSVPEFVRAETMQETRCQLWHRKINGTLRSDSSDPEKVPKVLLAGLFSWFSPFELALRDLVALSSQNKC